MKNFTHLLVVAALCLGASQAAMAQTVARTVTASGSSTATQSSVAVTRVIANVNAKLQALCAKTLLSTSVTVTSLVPYVFPAPPGALQVAGWKASATGSGVCPA